MTKVAEQKVLNTKITKNKGDKPIKTDKKLWYVYMVECADNTLYTGITTDLKRRVKEHNEDNKLGAKYTKTRRPVRLVYSESHPSRQTASRREAELKKLDKRQKEHFFTRQK